LQRRLLVRELAGKITLELKKDGTHAAVIEKPEAEKVERTGKWEVVKEEDKKLVVKITNLGAEEKSETEVEITFDGKDKLTLSNLPDTKPITMARVK